VGDRLDQVLAVVQQHQQRLVGADVVLQLDLGWGGGTGGAARSAAQAQGGRDGRRDLGRVGHGCQVHEVHADGRALLLL
jgi:hypothetical protein